MAHQRDKIVVEFGLNKDEYPDHSDDKSPVMTSPCISSEKSFQLLRKFLALFNVYFTFDEEVKSKKRRKIPHIISLINIYIAYLVAIEIRVNLKATSPIGLNLSLSSGIVIVLALRILLLKQVRLIAQSLKKSYRLLCVISKENCPLVMWHIPLSFTFCFLVTLAFFGTFSHDVNSERTSLLYRNYFFFGWGLNYRSNAVNYLFVILITILGGLELITVYAFPGVVLILCCYQYSIIVRINNVMSNRIKRSKTVDRAIKVFLSYYAEVEFTVKASENAVSPLIFFAYAYTLSCVFQATGVLVTSMVRNGVSQEFKLILLISSLVLLMAGVVSFIAISVHTSRIYQSAIMVRRSVFALLSTKQEQGVDFGLFSILLLLADDYPKQVLATGWGFFGLNGQFALKAVGGIITYAVILVQINDH